MLTINSYNKETLDRSSITIVDRYKGIVNEKVKDINDVKALTMMMYQTIYYYLVDAKRTLEQISEIVDLWESETGIDTTPIRDEIKHTEAMVEAVEEITDDSYGGSDDGDDEEIEEKVEAVESETEEVVEVIKSSPEVKEEVKEEVKVEARTELPSTPTTTTTPSVPSTPEEAKENARQEAADSIRSRADDGREFVYEQDPRSPFDTIVDVLTGNLPTSDHVEDMAEGARAEALDAAATVIENGGTAQEAVDAYLENINPPTEEDDSINAPNTYSPTDETSDVINQDIQDIIDAANEAASGGSGDSGDTPSCDEPSCDTPCDCCDSDCDCCDSDSCDDSCCDSDCDCCDGDCNIPVCDTPIFDVDDI